MNRFAYTEQRYNSAKKFIETESLSVSMTFEVTVDVIINVLNEIFQKKLPKTNPEFPETFLSQVPKINAEKLNLNTNLSANEIASLLFLDKNKKIDILSFLIEEQNISKQSPSNRKYSSLVHIQSFSVLFFEDLNHLTLDECQIFTKSLILAVKINPEVFELAFKAFSIFYSRLSDPQFFQFREIADYFLESLNKQWTPIFWNVLIHQSTRILKNIDINDIKNEENSSQNRSIQKHFLTIAKLMSIQNEIQLEFSSDDLFESIGNFFIDKIDDFEQSLIIFGIQLSGKTNSNFPQLISFLEILINNVDLFQNISKLADENECNSSCECLKFENILEIKQFETNCFDSIFSVFTKVLSKNLLLKIVVETTKRQINEKKINFIVFLLTFLSKEFVSKSIVSDFLRSNNEMNLLLPSILFQQDYLVNHSNQIIYSLELLSLSLYSNFLNSNSYPIELENLFDLFKDCEDKYNELLLLSSQFLHEIKLSNKFFQTMKIHFYTILHNEKLIENYKNILSQLLKSNYFVLSAMNSDEACICFCECLRISGFEEICKSFLLKYFELETVNHDISIFSTLYKAIKETSCKNKVYELVLNVISTSKKSMIKKILNPTFINTLQNSLIEPLTQKENSSVINDSGNINSNHQEETNNNMEEIYSDTNENTNQLDDNKNLDSLNDIPNVEIIFKILEFSRLIPNYDISWDVINEAIYHNTSLLTDNVYESILKILSNDDSFTGIHNKTATPLIKSLINSKYAEPFLLSVISIIANNYVQLLSIFNYGVVQILLESAPTLSDPLFELIMSIVVNINNIISNREIVEMFLSVFSKIVEEERSLKFLIYFEKSLKVYEHSHANVIHFDTLTSEIKLPVLSIEYFTHGFSFSTKLLIPNFNDGLCLLTVKSTNHYLSVILEKSKVLILSNHYSSPVEINLEFPENKWFTFKMKFISLDNILVQLDENTTLEISLSNCIPWTSQIRRIYMLKNYNSTEKRRNVEGFISQILIFSDFENKDLKDNKELNKYNSKSENLLYHFSPRHIYNGNVLKNLASKNINYYSLSNAKVDADCVSYIPTFAKVFTSFLGSLRNRMILIIV
ncbi:hypothetical protein TRFO_23176 [Tritrichomonas foetus]|uniref:Uncharacterized protein n=1 Tax=Tritrichomonas foetus TaxID=1144522 RepID=A0A1J4KBR0_9EUKA|nr:hypothetical protein TRFO_23176 [Tritrichomonas foetus]|eukprot:OHT08402.1 hypothetical protein TRFO_23176 [Tritrichomonas foetus]